MKDRFHSFGWVMCFIITGIVLTLTGCIFSGDVTDITQATPTPEIFIPRTMVVPNGPVISGHVFWGTTPVDGARVELHINAQSQADTAIAQTVSDAGGYYQLEAPPNGGTFDLVTLWPDGSANGAPFVTVEVSGQNAGVEADLFLAKAADELPLPCVSEDNPTYIDRNNGFCFAYPSEFVAHVNEIGNPAIYGPALDNNVEPLRASLLVEVEVAVRDKALVEIVDGYLVQFANMDVPPITRMSIELAGLTGELLEVVPGREGSRDVFMLNNGMLFHLMFLPSVRDFPQAKDDVELLYNTVVGTFSMISVNGVGPGQTVPPLSGNLDYTYAVITDAGLSVEIPPGWLRLEPEWIWIPSEDSALRLGVKWVDLQPGQEAEAVLLPSPAQVLSSEPVSVNWGNGRLFAVEVYTPATTSTSTIIVQSVELHAIIVVEHDGGRRAFDLFLTAPDEGQTTAQQFILQHMLETARVPTSP